MKILNDLRERFSGDDSSEFDIREKLRDKVYEIKLMVQYISGQGKTIEEDLLEKYASLSMLVSSWEDEGVVLPDSIASTSLVDWFCTAMSVYNKLSTQTRPANAVSIRFTEYTRGIFLERNKVVNVLMFVTFLCLLAFIVIRLLNFRNADTKNTLLILCASGLGAGFYTLGTVRKYLINRTFNPRYNPTYLIRFLLGITAGTILALIMDNVFKEFEYSDQMLALVGGFAADAVSTILRRISEILITSVRGITSDTITEERVTQERQLTKKQSDLKGIEELVRIKSEATKLALPPEIIAEIDKSIKNIETT